MNTLYKEYFITIKTSVHHKDNHKHMHPVTKHQKTLSKTGRIQRIGKSTIITQL